jgi:hypothetical protein
MPEANAGSKAWSSLPHIPQYAILTLMSSGSIMGSGTSMTFTSRVSVITAAFMISLPHFDFIVHQLILYSIFAKPTRNTY